MLEPSNGKLLVYASSFASRERRWKSVNNAAEKMARDLGLNVENVTFAKRFKPIYVYYKIENEEPIPIYCNKGEKSGMEEVCSALRSMMFVLSFHPKLSALGHMRREIMRSS